MKCLRCRRQRCCLESPDDRGQVGKRFLPEAIWQLQQCGSVETKVHFSGQVGGVAQV